MFFTLKKCYKICFPRWEKWVIFQKKCGLNFHFKRPKRMTHDPHFTYKHKSFNQSLHLVKSGKGNLTICDNIFNIWQYVTIFSDDGSKAVQLNDEQADWKPTELLHLHKGDRTYTCYCIFVSFEIVYRMNQWWVLAVCCLWAGLVLKNCFKVGKGKISPITIYWMDLFWT